MKFKFFNDTGREVNIHPATFDMDVRSESGYAIKPLETRVFILPKGTFPSVKMWDYGEHYGLSILVSPMWDV